MEKKTLLGIWLSRTTQQNTILDKTRNVIHFLGKMLRGIAYIWGEGSGESLNLQVLIFQQATEELLLGKLLR